MGTDDKTNIEFYRFIRSNLNSKNIKKVNNPLSHISTLCIDLNYSNISNLKFKTVHNNYNYEINNNLFMFNNPSVTFEELHIILANNTNQVKL